MTAPPQKRNWPDIFRKWGIDQDPDSPLAADWQRENLFEHDGTKESKLVALTIARRTIRSEIKSVYRQVIDHMDFSCEYDRRHGRRIIELERELDLLDRFERYIRGSTP